MDCQHNFAFTEPSPTSSLQQQSHEESNDIQEQTEQNKIILKPIQKSEESSHSGYVLQSEEEVCC